MGGAALEPVPFADLPAWAADDHAAALRAFQTTCRAELRDQVPRRPGEAPDERLRNACREGLATSLERARAFFETRFQPHRVLVPGADPPGTGFLTGYYEPELEGSLAPDPAYPVPLLGLPEGHVVLDGASAPAGLEGYRAAHRTPEGLRPYPDRAGIEAGALGAAARPVAWLRDPVDAFFVHVQGSARLRLPDGQAARVAFAGRNGHPYAAIGRLLVQDGRLTVEQASFEPLVRWLKANPDEARRAMARNPSYIFFRVPEELGPAAGPIGGAGVSLDPGRSLAVDRALWPYGLPVWLQGRVPSGENAGEEELARLVIMQDTGSAILGPARGDYFTGSGTEAGRRAGALRHRVAFVVLLPR